MYKVCQQVQNVWNLSTNWVNIGFSLVDIDIVIDIDIDTEWYFHKRWKLFKNMETINAV